MSTALLRFTLLAILTVASLAPAGCSRGGPAEHAGASIRVIERDFHISAPKRVPHGNVSVSILNRGPDGHEFIVMRAGSPKLPLRADGLTVDEDRLESETVGVLEPGEPGGVRHLRMKLAPGRYELICNMSGHYKGGMRTAWVVQ